MQEIRVRFSQSPSGQPIRPKLFGIGSAGCNIIEGASFPTVAFSTSSADLARSHAERKFLIGQDRLVGLSGPESAILKLLPSIAGHEMLDLFNNTDVAFLMCGLGGISGSLGAKLFSSFAKAKGVLGIALVTTPFSAESLRRREVADKAMSSLLRDSAVCVQFDNDKLSQLAPNLQLSRAFGLLNGIMLRPVMDLCSTMARLDVGPFKQIVGDCTYGRFGLGLARGDDRVQKIVQDALSSPWFDRNIAEARAAIAVYSAADPWDKESEAIMNDLQGKLPSGRLIWGSYADPALGERIRLSLVLCWKT